MVLTFSFDHTVLDIMFPETKLSHIKEPPRETSETTRGGKPQENMLFKDHLSFVLHFTFLLPSFLPSLLSLFAPFLQLSWGATSITGPASAITEHHSSPAIFT